MTYAEDLLNKVKANKVTNVSDAMFDDRKGTLIGSAIGLGVGLSIGYFRKYNLFVCAFLGAAAGGLVAKYMINKKGDER